MAGTKKYPFFFLLTACLCAAQRPVSANVPLTGGTFSVAVLASLSGGGTAAGGALTLDAFNMGGPSFPVTALSGGNFSLDLGAAPAVVTYETARADLGAAHCYPVPFKPSAGHTKITFTGLTFAARVRIYTLGGRLVRTLDKADSGDFLDWNVKNDDGEDIASGVYFFIVKSAVQTATGKLMVIR